MERGLFDVTLTSTRKARRVEAVDLGVPAVGTADGATREGRGSHDPGWQLRVGVVTGRRGRVVHGALSPPANRVAAMSAVGPWHDGELAAAVSNMVVGALARTTGRGPTRAKTTLGDNAVFVVLQDSLTRGEQTLAEAGEGQAVLDLRRRWQRIMQAEVSRELEELTGRKVIGFMSDNHIDPDIAVEVFVLEPLPVAAQ